MSSFAIPREEFLGRIARVQEAVRAAGLDALLVHSHEADFANVRYLSNYWPIFETAGVLVPAEGEAVQIIGPESLTFVRDSGHLPKIRRILEYRESADPDYPGVELDTFASVFAECGITPNRIGLAGRSVLPVTIYEALRRDVPNGELVPADDILSDLRTIKSDNEIACLREASRISALALRAVVEEIRPGITEQQVCGIAHRVMYEEGAEYEAHPTYVLSGLNTSHAIGRPSPRVLQRGDLVQLDIGARIEGYSPSVGFPVCLGKMTDDMRRLAGVCIEAHYKTIEWVRAGIPANEVVLNFEAFVKGAGCGENLLYGPCHGLGMIEVERPWMESHTTYPLQKNMTFEVDTFLYCQEFGMRYENPMRVTEDGCEVLTDVKMEIVELDF
jgi:Xaa-Pro aminopeptidase